MKRQRTNVFKNKTIVIVILFAILSYIGFTVKNTALSDRAIVTIAAIELTDDGKTHLALQVVKPLSGASGTEGAHSYVVLEETADSVMDALSRLRDKTGLFVSLAHCYSLVVSKEVAGGKLTGMVSNLVNEFKLPELCCVYMTEQPIVSIMRNDVPVSESTGFYLQGASSNNGDDADTCTLTIKDMMSYSLNKSRCFTMGIVDVVEIPKSEMGEQKPNQYSDLVMLDLSRAAVCAEGAEPYCLDSAQSRIMSLLSEKQQEAQITLDSNGVKQDFYFFKIKRKSKLEDGEWKVKLNLTVKRMGDSENEVSRPFEFGESSKQILEQSLTEQINALYELSQERDLDMFRLREQSYRKRNDWQSEQLLQDTKLALSLKIEFGQ